MSSVIIASQLTSSKKLADHPLLSKKDFSRTGGFKDIFTGVSSDQKFSNEGLGEKKLDHGNGIAQIKNKDNTTTKDEACDADSSQTNFAADNSQEVTPNENSNISMLTGQALTYSSEIVMQTIEYDTTLETGMALEEYRTTKLPSAEKSLQNVLELNNNTSSTTGTPGTDLASSIDSFATMKPEIIDTTAPGLLFRRDSETEGKEAVKLEGEVISETIPEAEVGFTDAEIENLIANFASDDEEDELPIDHAVPAVKAFEAPSATPPAIALNAQIEQREVPKFTSSNMDEAVTNEYNEELILEGTLQTSKKEMKDLKEKSSNEPSADSTDHLSSGFIFNEAGDKKIPIALTKSPLDALKPNVIDLPIDGFIKEDLENEVLLGAEKLTTNLDVTNFSTKISEIKFTSTTEATSQLSARDVPIKDQISLNIHKAVSTGTERMQIVLRPESLGRVDIHLEITNNTIKEVKIFAQKEALDAIMQDSKALEQTVQEITKDSDVKLSFNMRDDGSNPEYEARRSGAAQTKDGGEGYQAVRLIDDAPRRDIIRDDKVDVRI